MSPFSVRAAASAVALALAIAPFAAASSCTIPPSDGRYVEASRPDLATFPPVADLLSVRCGSIDCHGTVARNLRVYGSTGLRWLESDRPFYPLCNTPAEDSATYDSVVGLEPEAMSAVVAGGDPSLLTIVNKARGTEAHKGGTLWTAGDPSDTCLVSWLSGRSSPSDCESAVSSVLPVLPTAAPDGLLCCFGGDASACH